MTGGFVCAWLLPSVLLAQSNGTFDDVYYTASQARKDAEKAERQSAEAASSAEAYNSSAALYEREAGYAGYGEAYDNYIDYDDDSYTTRMRRFYYPMAGSGYWGSVYSPYWMDPFYSSPLGWGYPGLSFSMSVGFGSYWGGYPYGGFYSGWGHPYYGWGYPMYGYGLGSYYSGFWNGYYTGFYDAGYFNHTRYRNYGPRGARGSLYSGNFGGQTQRINPVSRHSNTGPRGQQRRESGLNRPAGQANRSLERDAGRRIQVDRPARVINNGTPLRVENERMRAPRNEQQMQAERPARRHSGMFNRRQQSPQRPIQRSYEAPARTPSYQAPAPQQRHSVSPSRSAPSRSFSAPSSGSRSSGASRGGGRR